MTKKVTMRVGRPNIAKEEKKQNVTVRIYAKDRALIAKHYRTAQKFVDLNLNALRLKEMQRVKPKQESK
jgi:hypothetical protein